MAGDVPAGLHTSTEDAAALERVLAEAAGGGPAVTGLDETLEAVACGIVCRLFLDRRFTVAGRVCRHCGVMQTSQAPPACPLCGRTLERVELADAMVEWVLDAGGTVAMMHQHADLAARGGVAACVRYPVPRRRRP